MSENFLEGASTTEGNSGSPAVTFGAAERSALNSAITRILRARWRGSAPTGADAELLRSNVTWRLNRDGSVRGTPTCRQTGTVTEANRPQSQLHCERAIRAVMTADFSSLPERFYSEWDYLEWDFDRSLL
ncbi:MAG: hypothetical protein JY451_02605 [Erythrobacter sp.]|nr:MAG: hypothetical protein JY451_02605 [Erythrobacter sp.]